MIYETTVSHPHHTLPCVLALANADRDTELIKKAKSGRRGSKSSQVEDTVQEVSLQKYCKGSVSSLLMKKISLI